MCKNYIHRLHGFTQTNITEYHLFVKFSLCTSA
nr:MAG TPA: hypothetical protein [Bacteriophage sp.]